MTLAQFNNAIGQFPGLSWSVRGDCAMFYTSINSNMPINQEQLLFDVVLKSLIMCERRKLDEYEKTHFKK